MRALVIGASGQVGAALAARLVERGHRVVGTHVRVATPGTLRLDLADRRAVEEVVAESEPDWIFCPAGLSFVDYCEEHPDEAYALNRDAPAAAAAIAAKRGAGFVYYSTEYVFDGTAGPYAEEDPIRPISVYGRSKAEGERRVAEENGRTLVVRTTVVYGPEPQGKNFVCQLLRRARAGERMTVPSDQRSSPTFNRDLASASVELVERNLTGCFHLAGPIVLDRHAFARLACEVFELDPGFIDSVSTATLRQRAARPLDAGLRIDRALGTLATRFREPREGLHAMRVALDARGGGAG